MCTSNFSAHRFRPQKGNTELVAIGVFVRACMCLCWNWDMNYLVILSEIALCPTQHFFKDDSHLSFSLKILLLWWAIIHSIPFAPSLQSLLKNVCARLCVHACMHACVRAWCIHHRFISFLPFLIILYLGDVGISRWKIRGIPLVRLPEFIMGMGLATYLSSQKGYRPIDKKSAASGELYAAYARDWRFFSLQKGNRPRDLKWAASHFFHRSFWQLERVLFCAFALSVWPGIDLGSQTGCTLMAHIRLRLVRYARRQKKAMLRITSPLMNQIHALSEFTHDVSDMNDDAEYMLVGALPIIIMLCVVVRQLSLLLCCIGVYSEKRKLLVYMESSRDWDLHHQIPCIGQESDGSASVWLQQVHNLNRVCWCVYLHKKVSGEYAFVYQQQ